MKGLLFILIAILPLAACQNTQSVNQTAHNTSLMPADNTTLIISYEAGKKNIALQAIKAMGGKIIYDYQNFNMLAVGFYAGNIEAVKAKLEKQPAILSVNRNHIEHTLN